MAAHTLFFAEKLPQPPKQLGTSSNYSFETSYDEGCSVKATELHPTFESGFVVSIPQGSHTLWKIFKDALLTKCATSHKPLCLSKCYSRSSTITGLHSSATAEPSHEFYATSGDLGDLISKFNEGVTDEEAIEALKAAFAGSNLVSVASALDQTAGASPLSFSVASTSSSVEIVHLPAATSASVSGTFTASCKVTFSTSMLAEPAVIEALQSAVASSLGIRTSIVSVARSTANPLQWSVSATVNISKLPRASRIECRPNDFSSTVVFSVPLQQSGDLLSGGPLVDDVWKQIEKALCSCKNTIVTNSASSPTSSLPVTTRMSSTSVITAQPPLSSSVVAIASAVSTSNLPSTPTCELNCVHGRSIARLDVYETGPENIAFVRFTDHWEVEKDDGTPNRSFLERLKTRFPDADRENIQDRQYAQGMKDATRFETAWSLGPFEHFRNAAHVRIAEGARPGTAVDPYFTLKYFYSLCADKAITFFDGVNNLENIPSWRRPMPVHASMGLARNVDIHLLIPHDDSASLSSSSLLSNKRPVLRFVKGAIFFAVGGMNAMVMRSCMFVSFHGDEIRALHRARFAPEQEAEGSASRSFCAGARSNPHQPAVLHKQAFLGRSRNSVFGVCFSRLLSFCCCRRVDRDLGTKGVDFRGLAKDARAVWDDLRRWGQTSKWGEMTATGAAAASTPGAAAASTPGAAAASTSVVVAASASVAVTASAKSPQESLKSPSRFLENTLGEDEKDPASDSILSVWFFFNAALLSLAKVAVRRQKRRCNKLQDDYDRVKQNGSDSIGVRDCLRNFSLEVAEVERVVSGVKDFITSTKEIDALIKHPKTSDEVPSAEAQGPKQGAPGRSANVRDAEGWLHKHESKLTVGRTKMQGWEAIFQALTALMALLVVVPTFLAVPVERIEALFCPNNPEGCNWSVFTGSMTAVCFIFVVFISVPMIRLALKT